MVETYFADARKNVHSQFGEDGIIEAIMTRIGVRTGYFVEFGAWDGRHLSNCAKLADDGWSGCYIEGDATRYEDLKRSYADKPAITCVNALVAAEGINSLDNILHRARAPSLVDVLSIDIDGNDYHVWAGLKEFRARLVLVEFNPTIPAGIDYVQPHDTNVAFGSSLSALTRLGREKGYTLVATTDINGIYLLDEICAEFGISAVDPLHSKSRDYETVLFYGYDGKVKVAGNRLMLWHHVEIGEDELQVLPKRLRRFPDHQGEAFSIELDDFRKSRTGHSPWSRFVSRTKRRLKSLIRR